MQTFLPYSNFEDTAKCLDMKRLGKQRVEAMQILQVIYRKRVLQESGKGSWFNHPAVLMWEQYPWLLLCYISAMVQRWKGLGYKDTCLEKSLEIYESIPDSLKGIGQVPSWLGDLNFHESHRSNLLRKNREHYSQFNWNVNDDLLYIWPSKKERTNEHAETDFSH